MAERRASTKPRSSTRAGAAAPKKAATQGDQVRAVLIEAARTQLAAVSAGISFWAGWVESADKYTLRSTTSSQGSTRRRSGDLGGRLSDLTREYLRNMTSFPRSR